MKCSTGSHPLSLQKQPRATTSRCLPEVSQACLLCFRLFFAFGPYSEDDHFTNKSPSMTGRAVRTTEADITLPATGAPVVLPTLLPDVSNTNSNTMAPEGCSTTTLRRVGFNKHLSRELLDSAEGLSCAEDEDEVGSEAGEVVSDGGDAAATLPH